MAERTLIIIKPDGIQRHLAGEIISRFEKKDFKLVAGKFFRVCEDLARQLYAVHLGKDFYEPLVKCLSSEPVLVTVWRGQRIITVTRKMMGATFGYEVHPGTSAAPKDIGWFTAQTAPNRPGGKSNCNSRQMKSWITC